MAEVSEDVRKEMAKADRAHPSEAIKDELLAEVNYNCPLCHKPLIEAKGGRTLRKFQVAHIYPHSATTEQYLRLHNLPREVDLESQRNLIPLCLDCHLRQDFHTTPEEYLRLYLKKLECVGTYQAQKIAYSSPLEPEISKVVQALSALPSNTKMDLSLTPLTVAQKIRDNLLCEKVRGNVVQYFSFVKGEFQKLQEKERVPFRIIATQVRHYFYQASRQLYDQELIFDQIVKWFMDKTNCGKTAGEIVVSFFVQDCEVFE